jgi:hypothetical protein
MVRITNLQTALRITLISLFLWLLPAQLLARDFLPFLSRNQSPLVQIFGLPVPGMAESQAPGKLLVNITGKIANNHSWDYTSDELVYFDGETRKVLAHIGYNFSTKFALNALTSIVHHSGGITDDFIYHFHRTFRLPQGRRELQYNGYLNYVYRAEEKTRLWLSDSDRHIGDTQIFSSFFIRSQKANAKLFTTVQAGVKLPTGNPYHLTGSGSLDFWGRLNSRYRFTINNIPSNLYVAFGAIRVGKFEPLQDMQKHLAGFGAAGLGLSLSPWITIQSQIDWHTPFYRSEFAQLGQFAGQIISGGAVYLSDFIQLQIGVSEDLLISTASDVVFYARIRALTQ